MTALSPVLDPAHIEAYVDAAAAVLALPLAPEHRPGVLRYFALAAEMADVLAAVPLTVHDEPAEAFVPISPDSPDSLVSAIGTVNLISPAGPDQPP